MSTKPLHNFDIIAPVYDIVASWVFGKSIKQAQLTTITWIPEGARVLIIGGGTGWYVKELLLQKNLKKVVYIESSLRMLTLTRQKIKNRLSPIPGSTLDLRLGTEEHILPGEQFDVIVTHFFLDIFEPVQLKKIANKLAFALKPEGIWLLADFVLPKQATGLCYWWKKALVKTMLLFFRCTSHITARELPDLPALMASMNMHPVYQKPFYRGLIFSSVYKKLTNR